MNSFDRYTSTVLFHKRTERKAWGPISPPPRHRSWKVPVSSKAISSLLGVTRSDCKPRHRSGRAANGVQRSNKQPVLLSSPLTWPRDQSGSFAQCSDLRGWSKCLVGRMRGRAYPDRQPAGTRFTNTRVSPQTSINRRGRAPAPGERRLQTVRSLESTTTWLGRTSLSRRYGSRRCDLHQLCTMALMDSAANGRPCTFT